MKLAFAPLLLCLAVTVFGADSPTPATYVPPTFEKPRDEETGFDEGTTIFAFEEVEETIEFFVGGKPPEATPGIGEEGERKGRRRRRRRRGRGRSSDRAPQQQQQPTHEPEVWDVDSAPVDESIEERHDDEVDHDETEQRDAESREAAAPGARERDRAAD